VGRGEAVRRLWRDIGRAVADVLFPGLCAGCGTRSQRAICRDCLREFRWLESWICLRCLGEGKRLRCGRKSHERWRCFVGVWFAPPVDRVVHAFKYDGRAGAGVLLGELLGELVSSRLPWSGSEIIVPVPLSAEKRRKRGFNQCEVLAEGVSAWTGARVEKGVLSRVAGFRSQTKLDREQRKANVEGAFELSDPEAVRGRKIIVLDDIVTTGSTLCEAVRVVAEGGAERVSSVVLAFAGRRAAPGEGFGEGGGSPRRDRWISAG